MGNSPQGQSPGRSKTPEWSRMVGASLKHSGVWPTYFNLLQTRRTHPNDLPLRGYVELVRSLIVRDLLSRSKGVGSVPRLTEEFQRDYARFDLDAQEGYLISLIDGSLSIEKLMKLCPSDHFTTLFNMAKLQQMKAIVIAE